jgi:hypothetical protein
MLCANAVLLAPVAVNKGACRPATPACRLDRIGKAHALEVMLTNVSMYIKYI